jgi:predicted DNA-binding protein YlxM (UPF0122 family)
MFEAIKPLLDSGIINEETRGAISEAWESKLSEARETIRAELREEMASRYEHDKKVMVEALDKMVTESLTAEIQEFASEKQAMVEDRVKFKNHMMESAGRFDNFLVKKLAEEIQELRSDRKVQKENFERLEKFVVTALAEEIKEFAHDKRQVVETKVRLVATAKHKLEELKSRFIARSSALVQETVTKNLKSELSQLKEDIQSARENMFGRRLFEAFASEFSLTHLNENKEIRSLHETIEEQQRTIEAIKESVATTEQIVESKEREIRIIKESAQRRDIMADLLKPLNREKATVMTELLENVQTAKLQGAYEKYLPAVLNNSVVKKSEKAIINESRSEVTGDKTAKSNTQTSNTNVIDLKRLAGL